jgi:hypothetical protein
VARCRPHQPPGVVVDHDGQVAAAALVADLIDADAPQPSQAIDARAGLDLLGHPGHDPRDRPPGHPQQLGHRYPGGVGGQPRRGVLKRAGEPYCRAAPTHLGHDHPVLTAGHPGRVGLQERADHPKVERTPASPPFPLVRAGTTPAADPTAAPPTTSRAD